METDTADMAAGGVADLPDVQEWSQHEIMTMLGNMHTESREAERLSWCGAH